MEITVGYYPFNFVVTRSDVFKSDLKEDKKKKLFFFDNFRVPFITIRFRVAKVDPSKAGWWQLAIYKYI